MHHLERKTMCIIPLLTFSLFLTSNACFYIHPTELNSRSLHLSGCHHFFNRIIGLAGVRTVPSRPFERHDVTRGDPYSFHYVASTKKLTGFPGALTQPVRRPIFSRFSRGRLNRMPLHFGKRLRFEGKQTLSEPKGRTTFQTYTANSLFGPGFVSDYDPFRKFIKDEINHRFDRQTDREESTKKSSQQVEKKSDEYVDDVWNEEKNSFNGRPRYLNKFEDRNSRSRLDRMPTSFGKRSGISLQNRNLSPLLSRIGNRNNPAYDNVIKRLAKLGYTFMRGSRLSRMPNMFGRKKKNEEQEAKNEESVKATRLNTDTSIDEARYTPINTHKSLYDSHEQYQIDLSPFIRALKMKLHYPNSLLRNQGLFPRKPSTLGHNMMMYPGIGMERRSTLSRMPITFGKRSRFGLFSKNDMHDSYNAVNRDGLGISIHPHKDDFSGRTDDETMTLKTNAATGKNIYEKNAGSNTISPMYVNYNGIPGLIREHGVEQRSSLNRMPISFGKRTAVEEIQPFHENNFGSLAGDGRWFHKFSNPVSTRLDELSENSNTRFGLDQGHSIDLRSSLNRMPMGFGKREIARLSQDFQPRQDSDFENVGGAGVFASSNKNLGINLRSSLSRMPISFGKRRIPRDVSQPIHENDLQNSINDGKPFYKSGNPLTSQLSTLAVNSNKDFRSDKDHNVTLRSSLNRMPMGFGKRNTAKVSKDFQPIHEDQQSENGASIDNSYDRSLRSSLNRMPISFGKRKTKVSGEFQPFYENNFRDLAGSMTSFHNPDNSMSSQLNPLSLDLNNGFGVDDNHDMVLRSSLNRMPISFGKRKASKLSKDFLPFHLDLGLSGNHNVATRSSLNRMPMGFGKRRMTKVEEDSQPVFGNSLINLAGSRTLFEKIDNPSPSSHFPLSGDSHINHGIDLRSSLNRMPMSFGKRTTDEDAEDQKQIHVDDVRHLMSQRSWFHDHGSPMFAQLDGHNADQKQPQQSQQSQQQQNDMGHQQVDNGQLLDETEELLHHYAGNDSSNKRENGMTEIKEPIISHGVVD